MKVLLLKDVYKLGRAGEVKKVADGYGRNFLLPQRLAALATQGALRNAETIKKHADELRLRLNHELSGIAEKLNGLTLTFPARAGETGKLYGSVTRAQIGDAIQAAIGDPVDHKHIMAEPLRLLGLFKVPVRLTVDLIPIITVIVHREGESPESVLEPKEAKPAKAKAAPVEAEAVVEAEAPEAELAGAAVAE